MSEPENYVSVPRVAEFLDVSESTVLRRIADGTLPARRFHCHWKLRLSEVEGVLAAEAMEGDTGVVVSLTERRAV